VRIKIEAMAIPSYYDQFLSYTHHHQYHQPIITIQIRYITYSQQLQPTDNCIRTPIASGCPSLHHTINKATMDHPAKRFPQGSVFDIKDASPPRGGSRNPSPPFHPPSPPTPPTPPPASSSDSTLPPQETSDRPCQVPSTPSPALETEKPGAAAARQSERADREDIKREMNKY
jgi:hypothetical protein